MARTLPCSREGCDLNAYPGSRLRLCEPHLTGLPASQPVPNTVSGRPGDLAQQAGVKPALKLLPTLPEAKAAAVEGREQAYDAADDDWLVQAEAIVAGLAAQGDRFTSNDVWAAGLVAPPSGNRRALGGVLTRAARAGLIVKVGQGAVSLHGHGSAGNSYWQGAGHAGG